MSHTPHIDSEYMFTYREPLVKALHRREDIVALPDWVMDNIDTGYEAKPWFWLRQHATCTIGIYNEYGKSLAEYEAECKARDDFMAERAALGLCSMRWGSKVCGLPQSHPASHAYDVIA